MYSADDALKDLENLQLELLDARSGSSQRAMMHERRIKNYLHEQRRKERIPELLRGG